MDDVVRAEPTFAGYRRGRCGVVDFACCVDSQSDGPNGVGIGMNVDLVQEIEIPSNTVTDTWQVNPRSCLILWEYIAYVQRGERLDKIGFTPTSSK